MRSVRGQYEARTRSVRGQYEASTRSGRGQYEGLVRDWYECMHPLHTPASPWLSIYLSIFLARAARFPSTPPPARRLRPVARAASCWAASEGMVQCGLPTVDGRCDCAAGASMAANADGALQPACDSHASQFAKPSRCPSDWTKAGYKLLPTKEDRRSFWIQKAKESALPPKNKNIPPEQNATTDEHARHMQRRPGAPVHGGGDGGGVAGGLEQHERERQQMEEEQRQSSQRHATLMEQVRPPKCHMHMPGATCHLTLTQTYP